MSSFKFYNNFSGNHKNLWDSLRTTPTWDNMDMHRDNKSYGVVRERLSQQTNLEAIKTCNKKSSNKIYL